MSSKFLDWVVSISLLIVILGIIGGHTSGEGAFSLSPFLSFFNQLKIGATNHRNVTEKPFSQVLKDAAKRGGIVARNGLQTATNGQTDPRLAACPHGSLNEQEKAVSLSTALTIQQTPPKTFIELQGQLGQPACIIDRNEWRYLVGDRGVLKAMQRGDKLKITVITNGQARGNPSGDRPANRGQNPTTQAPRLGY